MLFQIKNITIILQLSLSEDVETYGNGSICVDGVRSLFSHSCGTYIEKPVMPLCVAQETYSVNGSSQYALQFQGTHNDNVCTYVLYVRMYKYVLCINSCEMNR